MKLSCLWYTSNYRGDHSTDVKIAVAPDYQETVEHFAERILGNADLNSGDHLEIRIVQERKS